MSTKQKSVVVVLVILAGVIALLWWWRVREQAAVADKSTAPAAPVSTQNAANPTASSAPAPAQPEPPPTQKPSPELRRTFETLNHNEIEFYGRAVDQFGEPVVAAEVKGVVIVNTGTRGGEMHRQTTTDAQGYFKFSGFKGQDLGMTISKDGYEYRRHDSSFSYSYFEADHTRHIPDAKNPVVFILWKKQGAEPLVNYSKTFWEVPADGSPVKIDLATGKLGGVNADLIITLQRTPLKMLSGARGYPWKVNIEVVGGGLIRAGERDYYNVAPEGGYVPRLELAQEAQSVRDAQEGRIKWSWQDRIAESFFIKSKDGSRYAFIRLSVQSNGRADNDTTGSAGINVLLNPNASRNLEFDPAKVIKPTP